MSREMLRIREGRKVYWHWASNEIIDRYAKKIGAEGYAIYMYLARHANSDSGECCRSQSDIAETFGISRTTIWRHIRVLTNEGLISVTQEPGKPSTYTLTDPDSNQLQNETPSTDVTRFKIKHGLSQNETGGVSNPDTHNRKKELEIEYKPPTPFLPAALSSEDQTQITTHQAAMRVAEEFGFTGKLIPPLDTAIKKIGKDLSINPHDSSDELCKRWREYQASDIKFKFEIGAWLSQGIYANPDKWAKVVEVKKPTLVATEAAMYSKDGRKYNVGNDD